jgi:hypothetical protein
MGARNEDTKSIILRRISTGFYSNLLKISITSLNLLARHKKNEENLRYVRSVHVCQPLGCISREGLRVRTPLTPSPDGENDRL